MLAVWIPLLRLFSVPESTRREPDALGVTSVGVATRGFRNVSAHPTYTGGFYDTPTSIAVAAELLVGDVEPVGELPVTVPNDGTVDE